MTVPKIRTVTYAKHSNIDEFDALDRLPSSKFSMTLLALLLVILSPGKINKLLNSMSSFFIIILIYYGSSMYRIYGRLMIFQCGSQRVKTKKDRDTM